MIEFENVTKVFGNGTVAIENVTFFVDKGEFVIIEGVSGAGKSTLLRLMLKEIPFENGIIRIDGDNIAKISKKNTYLLRRKIGSVFQDYKVLMDRTVKENIALALDILKLEQEVIQARIEELLTLIGLEGKGDVFPVQLSGGELQRVIIARALAPQPKIIFADEPTGNLDEATALHIAELLKDINEQGTTVILATHDKALINKFKKRIIEIENGKIIKDTGKKKKSKDAKKEKSPDSLTDKPAAKKDKKQKPQETSVEENPTEKAPQTSKNEEKKND